MLPHVESFDRARLTIMGHIRPCRADDREAILTIVNAAAEAYRGVIPGDCWREPYFPASQLDREIATGVVFSGYESDAGLVGVMGRQTVRDVDLIRHAYVLPSQQGRGVGGRLLAHLRDASSRRTLVGTWADAEWAIRFYRRHGFELVSAEDKTALLKAYWTVSERQVEASVVLSSPPFHPG